MKRLTFAIGFCSLLSLQIITSNSVRALDSHRIARPTAADKQAIQSSDDTRVPSEKDAADTSLSSVPTRPVDSNESPVPTTTHKANAVVNLQDQQNQLYQNTISNWQNRNLPPQLQGMNGGTMDDAGNLRHKGLKSHLASSLGTVVGSVANAYLPVASVGSKHKGNSEPKIAIVAGHCPAAFDPPFQVPARWWDTLAKEEGDRYFGPQWKFWLEAVQRVFQARALVLQETPGVSSLHVIINPDGSIYSVTPYTGNERGNQDHAINERSLTSLRQIILTIGNFPAFPQGSQVRCYHLIFNGSAGI